MQLGGRRFLLSLAITAASVCLALGITMPIIRLTKYVFWTTEHSLLSTVHVLIRDGQIVIVVFVVQVQPLLRQVDDDAVHVVVAGCEFDGDRPA